MQIWVRRVVQSHEAVVISSVHRFLSWLKQPGSGWLAPAEGLGAAALPSCPPSPSGVCQLWSFQRAGSARAPLCGHAPAWSASVSGREQERRKTNTHMQLGATKADKRRPVCQEHSDQIGWL